MDEVCQNDPADKAKKQTKYHYVSSKEYDKLIRDKPNGKDGADDDMESI